MNAMTHEIGHTQCNGNIAYSAEAVPYLYGHVIRKAMPDAKVIDVLLSRRRTSRHPAELRNFLPGKRLPHRQGLIPMTPVLTE